MSDKYCLHVAWSSRDVEAWCSGILVAADGRYYLAMHYSRGEYRDAELAISK